MKKAPQTSSAAKTATKTVAVSAAKPKKKSTSTTKPVRKRTKADAAASPPEITEVEIATCAYFIYVSEGCPAGRQMDHWLEAEARLKNG
ncbi:MAG: DUF2934 domain-containing protein [Prosthecobacter sp.]|jgi:hypothetical protein|uniref:DUF2934 domain-containing protein n=1 Tax=Prosthecobacter sp. TaxID=1965333 RepID=UPI0019DC2019|nr:DUF2934 domain-containing protein [Prosthecobacter sp.]MBE2284832.1 DUF2934 domain-containing protein [Prosthecobacter sp.]